MPPTLGSGKVFRLSGSSCVELFQTAIVLGTHKLNIYTAAESLHCCYLSVEMHNNKKMFRSLPKCNATQYTLKILVKVGQMGMSRDENESWLVDLLVIFKGLTSCAESAIWITLELL